MRRALLIGSSYQQRQVDADLDLMAETLDRYRFTRIERCPRPATREAMIDALRELADQAEPDDVVAIYYAGHGGLARFHDPIDGAKQPQRVWRYLVPEDGLHSARAGRFRGVLDAELQWLIGQRLASRCRNVTLILDCCYAGGMFVAADDAANLRARGLVDVHEFTVPEQLRGPQQWSNRLVTRSSRTAPVVVAATTEARRSNVTDGKGDFTCALTRALDRHRGRRICWGHLIPAVRREVQQIGNRTDQEAHVLGPLGREVFGTASCEAASQYEVLVGDDGRMRLFAGTIHGLGDGDTVEIFDPERGRPIGLAIVREPEPARAMLEWRGDSTPPPWTSSIAAPRTRARPTPVRVSGVSPLAAKLRAALRASPWLCEAEGPSADTLEITIDHAMLRLQAGSVTRELRDPDCDSVVADLEAIARARAFVAVCDQAPAPPEQLQFWLRASRSGLITGEHAEIGLDELIKLGVKYAERYTGETLFLNVVDIGVDGIAYLLDETRGGINVFSEDPNVAIGQERSLSWPSEVPRQAARESLYCVLTSAPVDLTPLTRHDPESTIERDTRSRDLLERLFEPVALYVQRIDFTLRP